jgi:RNA polymerase sigma-70 factor (ECF subfamily)
MLNGIDRLDELRPSSAVAGVSDSAGAIAADDTRERLELFFRQQERRALQIARFSTRHSGDAADLVQEAMLKFVRSYSQRSEDQWPPLFHRILQNSMVDWQRRRGVRDRFRGWLGRPADETDEQDPFAAVADEVQPGPAQMLVGEQAGAAINQALEQLPLRQRQAFLLRNWQGLSVAETAVAMGCGQGSVKTHLSRALIRLRELLADYQQEANDD